MPILQEELVQLYSKDQSRHWLNGTSWIELIHNSKLMNTLSSKTKLKAKSMYLNTQKAKGIRFLQENFSSNLGAAYGLYNIKRILYLPEDFKKLNTVSFPVFARPCPLTPRHGFVESRLIKDFEQLFQLYAKTKQEDHYAEMVLMPPFTARFSAVINNAGITFGFGHDGATGQGGGIFIPAAPTHSTSWSKDQILLKDITEAYIQDTPYMELVEHKNYMYAVQLRDGPAAPMTRDFIPKEILVQHVLYAEGGEELLDWEKKVKKLQKQFPEGLAINFVGGSLSTHQAVHGIQRGIPVVTSRPILNGTTLIPEEEKVGDFYLTNRDYKQIAEWMLFYTNHANILNLKNQRCQEAILGAVSIFHSSQGWGSGYHFHKLRSLAPIIIARFLTAACVAEDRHFPGERKEMKTDLGFFSFPNMVGFQRETLYDLVVPLDWEKLGDFAASTIEDFDHRCWNNRRSFGGQKWKAIAEATLLLIKACNGFMKIPNNNTWTNITDALNIAVNLVHNGGASALSKWISQSRINAVATCPALGLASCFIADVVFETKSYDLNDLDADNDGDF